MRGATASGWKVRSRVEAQAGGFEAAPAGGVVPRLIIATAWREGSPYRVEAEIRLGGGRYRVASLSVQTKRGATVTATLLREVPVDRILRAAVATAFPIPWLPDVVEDPRALRERGPTDDTLRAVADLYRRALVQGEPPAATVQRALGLPRSTTGRWIARAREKGFLGSAEPRRAGERPPKRRKRT